jgi:hypothetical protein
MDTESLFSCIFTTLADLLFTHSKNPGLSGFLGFILDIHPELKWHLIHEYVNDVKKLISEEFYDKISNVFEYYPIDDLPRYDPGSQGTLLSFKTPSNYVVNLNAITTAIQEIISFCMDDLITRDYDSSKRIYGIMSHLQLVVNIHSEE